MSSINDVIILMVIIVLLLWVTVAKWDEVCENFLDIWGKNLRYTYLKGDFNKVKEEGDKIQKQNTLLIKTLTDINEKVNKYGVNPNLDPSHVIEDIADRLNEYVQKRDGETE